MEPKRRGFRNLAAKLSRLVEKSSSKHHNNSNGAGGITVDEVVVDESDLPSVADCERFDELELGVITKLYAELSSRSKQSQREDASDSQSAEAAQPGIDKATFTEYFQLPGLWADRLFKIFTSGTVVSFADFVHGLSSCCRSTKTEKVGILFKLFDLNNDGVVGRDELTAMLSNMPLLTSYLQSNKPSTALSRTQSKITVIADIKRTDDSSSSGRDSSSIDWGFDEQSSSSATSEVYGAHKEVEDGQQAISDEPNDAVSLLGPSPMVTEMLARVKRDAAVETESNDLEALVSNILDQYDACGNDSLDLESFRLFVDHHQGILKLFSDWLREDVWSLKGHALGRLLNKHPVESHCDRAVEQWISVRKQFTKVVPRQIQAPLVPIINGLETENEGASALADAEEKCTPPAASLAPSQTAEGHDTDVTYFLGLTSGETVNSAPSNSVMKPPRRQELNCPSCLAPLVICPKCDGRFPDLKIHKSSVCVVCKHCNKKSSECWICGFKFSLTLQTVSSDIQMQGDLYTADGHRHHFLLADRLLYYFDKDGDKVPSGFIFLEGCYVEALEGRCGFSIIPSKVSEKKKTLYAPDEDSLFKWLETLKSELSQRPIQELYEMHETIGQGKFSVVYRATEKETGESVAIKVVHKSRMNPAEKELLRSEMCIMRMLRHPHVIYLKRIVSSREALYIVMEYVPGGELFKVISRQQSLKGKKPLLEETAVHRLTVQLLKTLAYLHKSGIVHRDLKPENILLTNANDVGQADVKIADFGLSCLCGPNETLNQPCGTLVYAAPEVLTMKGYNHKVDVWSVGVVVYLLLCGKLPFPALRNVQSLNDLDAFFKVKFDAPSWNTVSPTCKDFICKLLVVDPQLRFSSQQALSHIWIKVTASPCDHHLPFRILLPL